VRCLLAEPGADIDGAPDPLHDVFTNSAGSWSQTSKLVAANGQMGDGFGFSVAISGGLIAVGKPDV
jgi:hypothetical protein